MEKLESMTLLLGLEYIPLTNQVQGLYCKLRTKFVSVSRLIAKTQSAQAINQ